MSKEVFTLAETDLLNLLDFYYQQLTDELVAGRKHAIIHWRVKILFAERRLFVLVHG